MKTAWIISIGTELSLGQSLDTNSAWIAAQLAGCGVRAVQHRTVPDELDLIVAALRDAAIAAELIVVSGGLGPTEDDLTRQALADAMGAPLETDPASLEQIRAFFTRRGREMPAGNAVQALCPRGAQMIENPGGTAPGLRARLGAAPVFVLPGVPREMKPMFIAAVLPVLQASAGGRVLRARVLHCAGMGESDIGQAIRDLMLRGRNPEVGTTAQAGLVGVRINATAASTAQADALLDAAEAQVRERLGRAVFGLDDDTLASAAGRLLRERRQTVCTAESCTGGLIGAWLTDVPGSSAYYAGGVVAYSNAVKAALLGVEPATLAQHGAVSAAVAQAMASGARERFRTDYAVSVTGIAGPGGGTPEKPVGLVYLGLASPRGAFARELRLGDDLSREAIRTRAARAALNWLRLELLDAEPGGR